MKINQKGFAAVEGLVVLLLVGALCIAGWYAWEFSTSKTITANKKTTQISTAQIPSDWITYQNNNLGISFSYPKTWAFEDKSREPTSTKAYYIGELTSDDKATTVGIRLMRKSDGSPVYSTIDEWKAYAGSANIKYSNLSDVKSNYTSFSYTLNVGGATGLVYEVFEPAKNVEAVVLPTESASKTTVEQILATLRLEG